MLKVLMHLFTIIILINNSMHTICMDTATVPVLTEENYFEGLKLIDIVQTQEAKSLLTDSMFQQNTTPELQRLSIENYIDDILALSPIIQDTNHSCHIHAYKCIQRLLAASKLHYRQDAAAPVKRLVTKTIEEHNAPLMNLLFSAQSPLPNNTFIRFLDQNQNTPLHLCIQHNFLDGITSICAHRDLQYLEDTNLAGDTPLVYALKMNRPECVKVLVNNHCIVDQKLTLDLANTHCSAMVPFLNDAQRPGIQLLPAEVLKRIWALCAIGDDIATRINSINFSSVCKQFLACKFNLYHQNAYPVISSIDLALASLDCKGVKEVLWKILNKPWHQLNEAQQKTAKEIIILYKNEELMNTGLDRNWMRGEGPTLLEYALCVSYRDSIIDLSFVQFLVENGAQINKKSIMFSDYKNLTPFEYMLLQLTAKNKRRRPEKWYDTLQCIQYFLTAEGIANEFIETNNKVEKELPILFIAIKSGCSDIALKIILGQKNINKNIVANYNDTSHTPLTVAVHGDQHHNHGADCYFSTINTLLAAPDIDINQRTADNDTALDALEWANELLSLEERNKVRSLLNTERHFPQQQPIATVIQNTLNAYNEPELDAIPANPQGPPGAQPIAAAHIQGGAAPAPAPVPGDNQEPINAYFFGTKPIYWITGISLCAVTAYVLRNYWCTKEKNDDEDDEDDKSPTSTLEQCT